MKQLFIVESPFQLINAFEAIHTFKSDGQCLFVRFSGNSSNDLQIRDTLTKLEVKKIATIKELTINSSNRNPVDYLKLLYWKLYFLLNIGRFHKVFIGNYDSPFMRLVIGARSDVVLLDDGFKSLQIQNSFTEDHYFDWFSIFDLKALSNQTISPNTYTYLHKNLPERPLTVKREVLFIGSKMSEIGVLSEGAYMHLMGQIAKRFSQETLIYIPHRGESETKLDKLSKIKNLRIKSLSYPVELLAIFDPISPKTIASFYSTALITLSKIYQVETIAFKFDYSRSLNATEIEKVYGYCKNHITVIAEENI